MARDGTGWDGMGPDGTGQHGTGIALAPLPSPTLFLPMSASVKLSIFLPPTCFQISFCRAFGVLSVFGSEAEVLPMPPQRYSMQGLLEETMQLP